MTLNCTDITFPAAGLAKRQAGRAGPAEWSGLAILALPTALLGLDVTLLYLALPALAADLQPSSSEALWIMDAYGFMIAGFLITMGTLGDRIGRRRLLTWGALGFGLASLLAAFTTSVTMLIVARALLGIAGAALMPSTLALISNMFHDPRQRALAIGVWATMFALGMAAGPLVGSLLLAHFWWGSAFLVALPVVGLLLALAPWLLPEYRAPTVGPLDLVSVLLSLLAILPLIYAIKEAAKDGIVAGSAAAFAVAIVFAILFVRRQRGLPEPLLDIGLFADRAFSAALGILLVGLIGVGGAMLLVTQYLQLVKGLPPVLAGLWMGPPALAMIIAGIAAPLIARRIRPAFVMTGALTFSAIGYGLLASVQVMAGLAPIVAGYSLVYLGLGTIAALGTDLVVNAAPPEKAGSASALSETVQELGIALGVALLGSLATAIYRHEIIETGSVAPALQDSLWAAMSVKDLLGDQVLDQAKTAFVSGLTAAAVVASLSSLALAVLSALMLRHIGTIGGDA